ncbi:MAG: hypothetical protein M1147_00040 [Nitrospirae bacterium]|nr:hypothetical protein [Nitrospirota bacterium]MCL5976503.1 hypothetical protein [Nitrospirota bacterium]
MILGNEGKACKFLTEEIAERHINRTANRMADDFKSLNGRKRIALKSEIKRDLRSGCLLTAA